MDGGTGFFILGLMAPECTLSDAPQSKSQTQTFPCPPPTPRPCNWPTPGMTESWHSSLRVGEQREKKGLDTMTALREQYRPEGKRAGLERGPTSSLGSR